MRLRPLLVLPALLLLAGAAPAQDPDRLDPAVQGGSEPPPSGTSSGSPDDDVVRAVDPDRLDTRAGNPDAQLEGSGRPVRARAQGPDALATPSQDASDLPEASVADQPPAPASVAPAPAPPEGCAQPSGDAGWNACLQSIQNGLVLAQQRLDEAEGAYSRSLTMHVPTGDARLAIVRERDAARADVGTFSDMLKSYVAQAQQAGVSSWVTAPHRPRPHTW